MVVSFGIGWTIVISSIHGSFGTVIIELLLELSRLIVLLNSFEGILLAFNISVHCTIKSGVWIAGRSCLEMTVR